MDNSFFAYLQQLELMAFFSGYPLVYAIIICIGGNQQEKNSFKIRAVSLLPFAYAFVGTLFLGFQLRKLYPDYSVEHLKLTIQLPGLVLWGLLSVLFWIPALAQKRTLSLIHSFVFFFFIVRDLLSQLFTSSANNDIIKNDTKIYSESLLLNLGAFVLIISIFFPFTYYKKHFS